MQSARTRDAVINIAGSGGACTQNRAKDISIGVAARLMHSNLASIDRDFSMPFTARTRATGCTQSAKKRSSHDRRHSSRRTNKLFVRDVVEHLRKSFVLPVP